jgi:integrase
MASVNQRNGLLFFDFRYQGVRCREYTKLDDTPANRKRMQKVLDRIQQAITDGSFDYGAFFPGSANAARSAANGAQGQLPLRGATRAITPPFRVFIEDWYRQSLPGWRSAHASTVRSTIDRHLVPHFGDTPVSAITKADLLAFRAQVATVKGRGGNAALSAKTVNRIMQLAGQALGEAAERYAFTNPALRIKRLKQRRVDIQPFSLTELGRILEAVREDYRPYMTVRFLTGMRTGELHGLKWKYVDFERRVILIRETFVRGEVEYTKTDGSQRDIAMSAPVFEALKEQRRRTGHLPYVFCSTSGAPIDNDNFTHRIWYPLLRHLGLEPRRPYQTRHTCATLWLAAGENPEWVARQLGHVNTLMLFRTYSRLIPNLTRTDGSAFNALVANAINPSAPQTPTTIRGRMDAVASQENAA